MIFDRQGFCIRHEKRAAFAGFREVRFVGQHQYLNAYEYVPWPIPGPTPDAHIDIIIHAPVEDDEGAKALMSLELTWYIGTA